MTLIIIQLGRLFSYTCLSGKLLAEQIPVDGRGRSLNPTGRGASDRGRLRGIPHNSLVASRHVLQLEAVGLRLQVARVAYLLRERVDLHGQVLWLGLQLLDDLAQVEALEVVEAERDACQVECVVLEELEDLVGQVLFFGVVFDLDLGEAHLGRLFKKQAAVEC